MANPKFPDKDPDDILDYSFDWTSRLTSGDTISASTWIVPTGIVKNSDSIGPGSKTTIIWLSGGTIGVKYTLTNRITTVAGRQIDQSVDIKVKTR
jgi:hypothetical protein